MPGLWAKFEANTTDPAIVLARMGAVPRQTEPCGRLTRKGTPCQQTRDAQTVRHGDLVFLSPACGTHLTDDERARRQVVLDAREEAERAANAIATPKCWAWDVDDAVRVAAMSADENAGWNAFVDWHDDRCAICGGRNLANPRVTDHDHHTGFIRGMLCQAGSARSRRPASERAARLRDRRRKRDRAWRETVAWLAAHPAPSTGEALAEYGRLRREQIELRAALYRASWE